MVWRAYGWRLTPQPELASTGVLRFGFMPVASPYAVFRAVDVIWPPQVRPPLEPAFAPVAERPPRPRKRRMPGLVQGELFPLS
jgi:hypothetical protein